jgi:cholesterol oxidase
MDVVQAAGLGGGSLIYANVFLFPPKELFNDRRWPDTCKWGDLYPYYQVAKSILAARPLPGYDPDDPSVVPDDPRRRVLRTEMFRRVAPDIGRDSHLAEINVFFGNDPETPLDLGIQEKNRFGKTQTSCLYCGECMIGCNTHSKNTLDLNYLHVAEHHYGARIRTEHLVEAIVPIDAEGRDSTTANGEHGYRVYYWDLSKYDLASQRGRIARYGDLPSLVAKRVIVSAGSLGSTELLLRNKTVHRTLPGISPVLGRGFSGNGDFLNFGLRPAAELDAHYGPVITQYTDYNFYRDFKPDRAFLVEDAAYPPIVGWFLEGFRPAFSRLPVLAYTVIDVIKRWTTGTNVGRIGGVFRQVLGETSSDRTVIYLNMGVDRSDGTMSLGDDGRLRMDWPYRNSMTLYRSIIAAGVEINRKVWARVFFPLLTWSWPFRRNITVHPLGGCVLGTDESNGVTNADRERFAEVFGYRGLYVVDGAIVPTAVGSNPTATISALSEMAAEGITGNAPTGNLLPDDSTAPAFDV